MLKTEQQIPGLNIFSGKRVLVVGLGKTGLSCVRFLVRRGVDVAVTDSRELPAELGSLQTDFPDVAVFVGGLNQEAMQRADVLLVSPGLSLKLPELSVYQNSDKEMIGDVEVFARCTEKPVIAITGSNGKSTVTSLLGEMARLSNLNVAVGGNIGIPVLDLIESDDTTELYVLELSSFQLETTNQLNPVAAVILNVSEDHMDRYDSLQEYRSAKSRIFHGDGVIVQNIDEQSVNSVIEELDASRKRIRFSTKFSAQGCDFGVMMHAGEAWVQWHGDPLIPVSSIKIKGWHNVSNVLAALALGTVVNLPMPAMLEAIRQFPGLPHRTQWVAESHGVTWFNDSKATNVGATLAAVAGLSDYPLILIMGGQGKDQDFSALKAAFADSVKHVLLLGEDADKIAEAIKGTTEFSYVEDMRTAVQAANQIADQGDAVVLSPACASFDMFSGYMHRGDVYMSCVQEVTQ